MVSIDTTRYSAVVVAFVKRYPEAVAKLDKHPQTTPVGQWCTNASLPGAIDFSLRQGNTELLAFHDSPRNMWACTKALGLVEELAAKHILQSRHMHRARRRCLLVSSVVAMSPNPSLQPTCYGLLPPHAAELKR